MAMIAARSPFSAYPMERSAVLHRGGASVPGQRPLRPHSRSLVSWRRNRQINRSRGRVAIASKGNEGNADKNSPELPLTEEECAAYERVNKTLPASPLLKQALSIEESAIAIAGRSFEIVAVVIMSMYGIKALQIGLYDGPTFAKFFFEVRSQRLPARYLLCRTCYRCKYR
mmetsp:Transcript_8083/g.14538  ORF Transcript_8083/g.14538 Transcript_8083/m.14538 type:complete len:171 (-) Transcript_8083:242-754(-)